MNRPRKLDPEATRDAIIRSAHVLFVEKGVNGASMSAIARGAGVTKSLIHHHFGSKQELWNEVKMRGMGQYLKWQREVLVNRDADDEDVLLDSVEAYFKFLRANPDVVRLMTWMAIEPENSVKRDTDLIQLGVDRLKAAQELGLVRPDIDAESVLISVLSLCEHYHQFCHVFRDPSAAGVANPDAVFLDTMMKITAQGIAATDDDGRLVRVLDRAFPKLD